MLTQAMCADTCMSLGCQVQISLCLGNWRSQTQYSCLDCTVDTCHIIWNLL